MEDGRWKMEDGRWKMEDGRKETISLQPYSRIDCKTAKLQNC